MKAFIPIFLISLIIGIHCKCGTGDNYAESPSAEECFGRTITSDDIGDANANDFLCCYMKIFQNSNSQCFVLEKSRKDGYYDEMEANTGNRPYALGCSLDELTDESKSNSCYLQNPIKKDYCFTRSLSSEEKQNNGYYSPNKCCYVEYNSEVNFCQALDETKIDDYINLMKQSLKSNGGDDSGLKVICSSSSTSSNQRFIKVNNILFFIISLILF